MNAGHDAGLYLPPTVPVPPSPPPPPPPSPPPPSPPLWPPNSGNNAYQNAGNDAVNSGDGSNNEDGAEDGISECSRENDDDGKHVPCFPNWPHDTQACQVDGLSWWVKLQRLPIELYNVTFANLSASNETQAAIFAIIGMTDDWQVRLDAPRRAESLDLALCCPSVVLVASSTPCSRLTAICKPRHIQIFIDERTVFPRAANDPRSETDLEDEYRIGIIGDPSQGAIPAPISFCQSFEEGGRYDNCTDWAQQMARDGCSREGHDSSSTEVMAP